jgi:hypothetical protein
MLISCKKTSFAFLEWFHFICTLDAGQCDIFQLFDQAIKHLIAQYKRVLARLIPFLIFG